MVNVCDIDESKILICRERERALVDAESDSERSNDVQSNNSQIRKDSKDVRVLE